MSERPSFISEDMRALVTIFTWAVAFVVVSKIIGRPNFSFFEHLLFLGAWLGPACMCFFHNQHMKLRRLGLIEGLPNKLDARIYGGLLIISVVCVSALLTLTWSRTSY
jgi:hypothetical protein